VRRARTATIPWYLPITDAKFRDGEWLKLSAHGCSCWLCCDGGDGSKIGTRRIVRRLGRQLVKKAVHDGNYESLPWGKSSQHKGKPRADRSRLEGLPCRHCGAATIQPGLSSICDECLEDSLSCYTCADHEILESLLWDYGDGGSPGEDPEAFADEGWDDLNLSWGDLDFFP